MAGMGMRDIKRRIKSVNSTKQITKAMELVASAKLRRSRERVDKNRAYFDAIKNTVQDIFEKATGIQHEFTKERQIKKSCYIVITADRGLCGGYNANAIKAAVNHMQGKKDVSVITIGQKARDYFKNRKYNFDGEIVHISENPTYAHAKELSNSIIQLYKKGVLDEIFIVYTKFVSTISYVPQVIKLLPFKSSEGNAKKNEEFEYISYEPSPEALLDYLIPKYIESTIYGALIESSASEQGARRMAMENATDNAEEMIDHLTLSYNRARQAAITQEIAEIVGGAESLK